MVNGDIFFQNLRSTSSTCSPRTCEFRLTWNCRPPLWQEPQNTHPCLSDVPPLRTPTHTHTPCPFSVVHQAPWPPRTSCKPQPALRKLLVKGFLLSLPFLSPFTALCPFLREAFLIASTLPAQLRAPPSGPTWTGIRLPSHCTPPQ